MSNNLDGILADILKLPPDKIADDLALRNVPRWDSLQHMQLVVALEGAYGLQFTFDEIASMTSIGLIRSVLGQRGAI